MQVEMNTWNNSSYPQLFESLEFLNRARLANFLISNFSEIADAINLFFCFIY